jgi:hypothetical protein
LDDIAEKEQVTLPILVLGNKYDLPAEISQQEVTAVLTSLTHKDITCILDIVISSD